MLLLALGCAPEIAEEPAQTCAEDEVLEGARCLPEACGVGVWGNLPVEEADAFVDPAAPDGGDGTLDRPFRTITEAVTLAPDGLILLAAGDHPGRLRIREQPEIVGRCRELVTLVHDSLAVEVWYPGGTLRHLSIASYHGVEAFGGEVVVEDVEIRGQEYGISVFPSDSHPGGLRFTDLTIHQTGVGQSSGLWLNDFQGGQSWIEGDGLVVTAESTVGVQLAGGTTDLTDVVITMQGPFDSLREALSAESDASVVCTDCRIEQAWGVGVVVHDGAELTLVDSSLQNVLQDQPDEPAVGVLVGLGGTVTLNEVTIDAVDGYGIGAIDFGRLVVDGLTVTDTGQASEHVVAGIYAQAGGSVVGQNVTVLRSSGVGIAAENQGTLELSNVTIDTVTARVDVAGLTLAGPGVLASDSSVVLRDVHIVGAEGYGLVAQQSSGLWLTDVLVEQTLPPEGGPPLDVLVQGGSVGSFEGVTLDGGGHGLIVSNASVSGDLTLPPSDGVGLIVLDGGSFTGSVQVDGRRGWAIGAHESTVQLVDSTIENTARDEDRTLATAVAIADGTGVLEGVHIEGTQGIGAALEGGSLTLVDCEVVDSELAGVFTARGALVVTDTTVDGVVSEDTAGIGVGIAAIQSPDAAPGVVTLDGSRIEGADHAAVWLGGSGAHTLTDTTLVGGPRQPLLATEVHGDALVIRSGQARLVEVTLESAEGAGLLLHDATAELDGCAFNDNAVDIWQQACGVPIEAPEGTNATLCPATDQPVLELDFYNAVRLGDVD